MRAVFYILFGALFTAGTSFALGSLLLRALTLRLHRWEARLLAFVSGSACLSMVVFTLCAVHWARKGVFLALGIAAMAAAAVRTRRSAPWPSEPGQLPRAGKWIFGVIFALFSCLYFLYALAPEMSPDGMAYHLALVARFYRAHGFERLPLNLYANISGGVDLLFLFAFAFGKHSAGALVHLSFLVALPLLLVSYARRFGFPAAGLCAAALVYASPVFGIDGSSAYVDVAAGTIVFSLFYLLQIWAADRDDHLLIPIGMLAGFCYAAKYTVGIVGIPYAFGFVLWRGWRTGKPALRPALVVGALASFWAAPWIVKDWLWVANPVAPFANAVFRNPWVHISFEHEYSRFLRNYDLPSLWEIPIEVTVRGWHLCGLLGPVFLLLPLGLLSLRRRSGQQLLLAGAVFLLPYVSNIGTRFLIPCIPFFALALALAIAYWPWALWVVAGLHAVLSLPPVIPHYASQWAWHIESIPWEAALRIETENGYLQRASPGYAIDRMLEARVPPKATVYAFSQIPEAYTTRNVVVKYLSAPGEVLSDMFYTALYPNMQPALVLQLAFPERRVRKLRLVQTATLPSAMWNVSELRVFDRGQELARNPEWRLTARPNPWDVQLAFDNDPVTRWRSWEPQQAGMHIDIDFGEERPVDGVRLETVQDWRSPSVRLEGAEAGGGWSQIPAQTSTAPNPIGISLRRAATRELKSRGIEYLLVSNDDFGAADFEQRAANWGLRQIDEAGGSRLYQVE